MVAAARKGWRKSSRQRGLPTRPIPELDELFKAARSQQVDESHAGLSERSAPQARYRRNDGDRPVRLQRGDDGAHVRLRAKRRGVVASGVVGGRTDSAGHGRRRDAQRRSSKLAEVILDHGTRSASSKSSLDYQWSTPCSHKEARAARSRVDLVDNSRQVIASPFRAPASRRSRVSMRCSSTTAQRASRIRLI